MRCENSKMRKEMGEIEISVMERIGYLQRYKSVAMHKIGELLVATATMCCAQVAVNKKM